MAWLAITYIALLTTVTLALAGAYLAWTALDVMDRWRTTPGGVCSAGSWSPSDGSPTINDLQPDPSRSKPRGRLGAVGVRGVITGADESLDVHDEGMG